MRWKKWRKRRNDAQAKLDKRRSAFERARKEKAKKRARKAEELVQVCVIQIFGLKTLCLNFVRVHVFAAPLSKRASRRPRSAPARPRSLSRFVSGSSKVKRLKIRLSA